jgi:MSHA pilin protein MshD
MTTPFQRCRKGFSLIEAVVLIVVVGLAVSPLVGLFREVVVRHSDAQQTTMAVGLARGLMEEILSKSYEDPQAGAGSFGTEEGSRTNYDDVDDYDGLNEKPPRDNRNNALNDFSAFRTRATVVNVQPAAPGGSAAPDGSTDFKRVTVTVSWNNGGSRVRLVGLAGNYTVEGSTPQSGWTYLGRSDVASRDVRFFVRNDTGDDVYLTHVTASWTGPEAYYDEIKVKAVGYSNYGSVWSCLAHNFDRAENGETCMFNLGDVVRIPNGTVARIQLDDFKDRSNWPLGSSVNMESTPITVELWAAPDTYVPFTVEALD